jgi:hypothetical protein
VRERERQANELAEHPNLRTQSTLDENEREREREKMGGMAP